MNHYIDTSKYVLKINTDIEDIYTNNYTNQHSTVLQLTFLTMLNFQKIHKKKHIKCSEKMTLKNTFENIIILISF